MTHEQLLVWGESWHYPYLAIAPPLRHGKDAYLAATPEQVEQAGVRIAQGRALGIVDRVWIRGEREVVL